MTWLKRILYGLFLISFFCLVRYAEALDDVTIDLFSNVPQNVEMAIVIPDFEKVWNQSITTDLFVAIRQYLHESQKPAMDTFILELDKFENHLGFPVEEILTQIAQSGVLFSQPFDGHDEPECHGFDLYGILNTAQPERAVEVFDALKALLDDRAALASDETHAEITVSQDPFPIYHVSYGNIYFAVIGSRVVVSMTERPMDAAALRHLSEVMPSSNIVQKTDFQESMERLPIHESETAGYLWVDLTENDLLNPLGGSHSGLVALMFEPDGISTWIATRDHSGFCAAPSAIQHVLEFQTMLPSSPMFAMTTSKLKLKLLESMPPERSKKISLAISEIFGAEGEELKVALTQLLSQFDGSGMLGLASWLNIVGAFGINSEAEVKRLMTQLELWIIKDIPFVGGFRDEALGTTMSLRVAHTAQGTPIFVYTVLEDRLLVGQSKVTLEQALERMRQGNTLQSSGPYHMLNEKVPNILQTEYFHIDFQQILPVVLLMTGMKPYAIPEEELMFFRIIGGTTRLLTLGEGDLPSGSLAKIKLFTIPPIPVKPE